MPWDTEDDLQDPCAILAAREGDPLDGPSYPALADGCSRATPERDNTRFSSFN